ncbi:unnamed protein product [Fraxinus pennsylvanica]|uniref:Uncharacterized protein n=1 Tax=Fraxinus pennsylvanica TaxID=56036 RepID=A0AAD2A0X7_9LAMI|nr:unnamed protein product [Fraxinus pennsylvanica]
MNFLMLRSNNQTGSQEQQHPVQDSHVEQMLKRTNTLGGLIAEDPFQDSRTSETRDAESDEYEDDNGSFPGSSGKSNIQIHSHVDVAEDEGWIIIPYKEIPNKWIESPDILSFCSLDRGFVFPGEQVRVLACLSTDKHDTEIITPFKVAAVMNRSGVGQNTKKQNEEPENETNPVSQIVDMGADENVNQNGENMIRDDKQNGENVIIGKMDSQKNVSVGESLLRMEDNKRKTESLLQRFNNSHFFARIVESNEPLWSKRRTSEDSVKSFEMFEKNLTEQSSETVNILKKKNHLNAAAIDRGEFDARTSGGLARNAVKCCSLSNGDLVVLLQVNVGVESVQDPVLEILQLEKCQERNLTLDDQKNLNLLDQDPYGELLEWLLPLDNSIPPPARPSLPPKLSSSSSIRSTSTKPTVTGSSGSQIFSFGHFRSYSMSSLPPNTTPPPAATTPSAKPSFDPEDWNQFSFRNLVKSRKTGNDRLLSFRGVPLESERFSIQCGLEGIFTPGRRWRRKIEIIEPVEICSFSADYNTDDLLCVQIKNVSPEHAPDIVVFIDAIAIILEEALKDGTPLSLPIACIEAGDEHCLPNLALRRGEEHSFILKPATSFWKHPKGLSNKNLLPSYSSAENGASSLLYSSCIEGKESGSPPDHYAVLVSCRCNYTESKLFFKQPTSWRPRFSRDLMISVTSEMSRQAFGSDITQLPVQVLTLQASNMTSEDLTFTVLAPSSYPSPPPAVSLSNSPSSPLSSFVVPSNLAERVSNDEQEASEQRLISVSNNHGQEVKGSFPSASFSEQPVPIADVLPTADLGCTHLWLQSRVPLGCVPSQSTAAIKLEVLPLTDGIISLDSLQIYVKERGLTYIPEHLLKINATSSITTGSVRELRSTLQVEHMVLIFRLLAALIFESFVGIPISFPRTDVSGVVASEPRGKVSFFECQHVICNL